MSVHSPGQASGRETFLRLRERTGRLREPTQWCFPSELLGPLRRTAAPRSAASTGCPQTPGTPMEARASVLKHHASVLQSQTRKTRNTPMSNGGMRRHDIFVYHDGQHVRLVPQIVNRGYRRYIKEHVKLKELSN